MNDNNLEAERAAPTLKQRAREICEALSALDTGKKPGTGVHGQVIGCEPWVIRTNGYGLQCLHDAQALLHELLDPFDQRRHPAVGDDGLPRWIDDQKGKDPLMDDMIAYIIDLRAQLASERQAKEYEQQHAVESEKALAEMQAQLARQSQGEPGVERRRDLAHAPLPLDAEVALEHAALALDKAGDQGAHDHVVQVLAAHLPTEDTGGGAPD